MLKSKINIKKVIEFIFIFIFILSISLFFTILGNDEIWNYGFSNNLYNGLIPYKDFNMVITPFFPFLMSLSFYVFGSSILVFSITNALIISFLFYLLEQLFGSKKNLFLFFMIFPISILFPSYNMFLFALLVLLIYLEKNSKSDYLIGFVLGLFFLTKQTVGGLILIVNILYYMKNTNQLFKRLIGCLIPCFVLVIYLVFNHAFFDFIDQCFLGLFDFGSKNSQLFNFFTIIVLCFFAVNIVFILKNPKIIENYYILAFFSITIPLIDIYHTQIALLAFIVLVLSNININIKYDKYINFFVFFTIVGICFIYIKDFNKPIIYPNNINHFQYRLINNDNLEFTKKVNKYIKVNKDRKIFILTADAYYFKIINDMKVDKLDLINNGNYGYNGSNKIIKEINKNKDALFIINEIDFNKDSQIDYQAIQYVKDHGKKISSIDFYDVYSFK